jgi:hypothetical protein
MHRQAVGKQQLGLLVQTAPSGTQACAVFGANRLNKFEELPPVVRLTGMEAWMAPLL